MLGGPNRDKWAKKKESYIFFQYKFLKVFYRSISQCQKKDRHLWMTDSQPDFITSEKYTFYHMCAKLK